MPEITKRAVYQYLRKTLPELYAVGDLNISGGFVVCTDNQNTTLSAIEAHLIKQAGRELNITLSTDIAIGSNWYPRAVFCSTGKALDRLEPLPNIWYEKEDGEKYIPTEEEMNQGKIDFNDYIYQHVLIPEVVESITTDEGSIGEFHFSGINVLTPIVLYLIQNRAWTLADAVTIASSCCSRCLNLLLKEAGEPFTAEDDEEVANSHTHCELCKVIDPEYDLKYRMDHDVDGAVTASISFDMNLAKYLFHHVASACFKFSKSIKIEDIFEGTTK